MNIESILSSEVFKWGILPLLIFLARIIDVSLGTMRIVFVSKGMKYLAPITGFFEVIIWLLAIRVIMQNLNNAACYFAYGAGFAMGTFIGIKIENKMALGTSVLRIITSQDASELIDFLRSKKYGVTSIEAQGSMSKVNVIFMIIKRQSFKEVSRIIQRFNPRAFYTVEDVRMVSEGIFPMGTRPLIRPLAGPFRFWRKGK
jgi:uncharacterized protein YebE (UPF0316 family)